MPFFDEEELRADPELAEVAGAVKFRGGIRPRQAGTATAKPIAHKVGGGTSAVNNDAQLGGQLQTAGVRPGDLPAGDGPEAGDNDEPHKPDDGATAAADPDREHAAASIWNRLVVAQLEAADEVAAGPASSSGQVAGGVLAGIITPVSTSPGAREAETQKVRLIIKGYARL